MTKLLVFGDTDAPMFQIISEASHQVDWVEAWPLSAFKTQIRRHAGAPVMPLLVGAADTRFIAFYNEVILENTFTGSCRCSHRAGWCSAIASSRSGSSS
jgi:hypothetical protein